MRKLRVGLLGVIASSLLLPLSAVADPIEVVYPVPSTEAVPLASLTPPVAQPYFTDLDGTVSTPQPTALPGIEPVPTVGARSAALPGDCAQVRQLIAEKKVPANALWWGIMDETPVSTRSAAITADCRAMQANRDSWTAYSRFYACYHARKTVMFFRPATLSVEASVPIDFYQAVQLDPRSLTVTTASEAKLGFANGTVGRVSNIKLTTDACEGCSVQEGVTSKIGTSIYESTATLSVANPGINARRWAGTSLKAEITASVNIPFVLVNKTLRWQSLGVGWECDTEQIGQLRAPGCVFPAVVPPVLFDGRTPENGGAMYTTAIHMHNAMESGLPGKIGSGRYLTRTSSQSIQAANRNTACPTSLPRPLGFNCDDHPFASTLEGAAANTREPRTFWYCKLDDPQRTGPLGFSRCMAPASESSCQDSALNSGYIEERIRKGDKFSVGWSQV